MTEQEFVERATYFAKDEVVSELLRRLKANYIDHWEKTAPNEMSTRDGIYSLVRVINDLQADLLTVASGLRVTAFNRRFANPSKAR